jgi:hypothetical protein
MTAYEFYWRDAIEGYHLIGILPERRRTPERITRESIMNWGKIILGETLDPSHLFFVPVSIHEDSGRVYYSKPTDTPYSVMLKPL